MKELENLVSDEKINAAWGSANFGSTPRREVIKDTLLKCAGGTRKKSQLVVF